VPNLKECKQHFLLQIIFPPTSYLKNAPDMFPFLIITINSLLAGTVYDRWKRADRNLDPNTEIACLLLHIFKVKPWVVLNEQKMIYWKFTLPLSSDNCLFSEWHKYYFFHISGNNWVQTQDLLNTYSIEKDTISYHCNHWVNISLYCINFMSMNISWECIMLMSVSLYKHAMLSVCLHHHIHRNKTHTTA
jgi:hypothetical protein